MAPEATAIVGRGCVLPGALDPDQLWENVLARKVSLGPVPDGRWRLSPRWVMGIPPDCGDQTWTDVGGYVRDFASVFDPSEYQLSDVDVAQLDPLFQWTLHAVGAALREAGAKRPPRNAGLIMGNLSYPSSGLAAYAEHV